MGRDLKGGKEPVVRRRRFQVEGTAEGTKGKPEELELGEQGGLTWSVCARPPPDLRWKHAKLGPE